MSVDITPKEARKYDHKLLTQLANQYRPGTGVHTVVLNEISRRANRGKSLREWLNLALRAWPIIFLPIVIWLYKVLR